MSKFGAVGARGLFAHLQSAGMGGYGAPVVQGVARLGSVVVGATKGWYSWYSSKPSGVDGGNVGIRDQMKRQM